MLPGDPVPVRAESVADTKRHPRDKLAQVTGRSAFCLYALTFQTAQPKALPEIPQVTNFSHDWENGDAYAVLLHSMFGSVSDLSPLQVSTAMCGCCCLKCSCQEFTLNRKLDAIAQRINKVLSTRDLAALIKEHESNESSQTEAPAQEAAEAKESEAPGGTESTGSAAAQPDSLQQAANAVETEGAQASPQMDGKAAELPTIGVGPANNKILLPFEITRQHISKVGECTLGGGICSRSLSGTSLGEHVGAGSSDESGSCIGHQPSSQN